MSEHLLVKLGKDKYEHARLSKTEVSFISDNEQDAFLNDLENYPHAFVLACLMDRQMKAEIAWQIPYKIKNILGTFDIYELGRLSLIDCKNLFNENKLHRFNDDMAECFYLAIQRIINDYDGDASNIWKGEPSSAAVVYRFLQFKGMGIKIATMATNILARDFCIPFSDYYSIDISPDIHIMKIMRRTGLVPKEADREMVVYKARELCPEFPGIIDSICWEIGREYCKPSNPKCLECPIERVCEKHVTLQGD